MEAMDDDSSDMKDDHNHNYCASGGGKVRAHPRSQLSVPRSAGAPEPGAEPETRRGKLWPGSTGSKFMDSDSGSESSEVSEADCAAPPAAGDGTSGLDSTSKFRESTGRGPGCSGGSVPPWSLGPAAVLLPVEGPVPSTGSRSG